MSARTATKTVVAPMPCTQCRKLVRFERKDGALVLVNDASGTPHVCGSRRR